MRYTKKLLTGLALLACSATFAEPIELVLQTNKPGAPIQPTMYGIFFEDINYAADGGLYAEKIKNRSFEFPQSFMGWNTYGKVKLMDDGPFERNPHYVRLSNPGHAHKHSGLENEGFFGVSVERGVEYRFSVWARTPEGGESTLRVQLVNTASNDAAHAIAEVPIKVDSKEWKKYTAILTPEQTVKDGKLRILLGKPENTVDLEHISLFPVDTWMGHENGMRKDLAQKLADLHPGIFRFPGGCIVEGTDLESRYQWKNSVGPVENRPLNENRWHYTFDHRFYPDYYQSYGLGFYEFFLLSEEIGSEPLPIISVGLACQFQNDDPNAHVPVDQLDPYIQDALDLIEFANGDTTTKWGKLRADMGHPEPFNLKYIGIGNEQWGEEYPVRLEPFLKVLRKQHPEIKIVGSSGPNSEGEQFDYLWPEMKRLNADLVDEHFYRPESWFLSQAARYDNYDRKGPKVFAGEYACHGVGEEWPPLMEAAFMTGLERNADIVHMATYAPLFAHVEGWQWRPDLIWYDNFNSYPTASYFVQQLYSENKGTKTLPLLGADKKPLIGADGQNGLYASAVIDEPTGEYIIKIANTSGDPQEVKLHFAGMKKKEGINSATVKTMQSNDPKAENSLEEPNKMMPKLEKIAIDNAQDWTTIVPAKSFQVYRFKK